MSGSISRIDGSESRSSGAMHRITDQSFFEQDAIALARDLLGKLIVHQVNGQSLILRITETEAYMGAEDLASHSRGGRITPRNRVMFGDAGRAYLFLIYGLHWCFNITANRPGLHEAVLIRAGVPVMGEEVMAAHRMTSGSGLSGSRQIANGPGKLCQALGLNRTHYGIDLKDQANELLWIASDDYVAEAIEEDVRIGIDYAGKDRDRPWRFYINNEPVSLTREQREKRHKGKRRTGRRG
ncbi:putative 3-methyladenine DNA glycosylase [anaerobic digester metagenome]